MVGPDTRADRRQPMFYEPRNFNAERDALGLSHSPFKALVAPRPIGWISTRGTDGRDNLAPYSFFNGVAEPPPMVMFAPTARPGGGRFKDSLDNVRDTGEFVVNLVTWDLREAMNRTSTPVERDVDEFAFAGVEKAPCRLVAAPRVATAPAALECRVYRIVDLPPRPDGGTNHVVIGEVVGVHVDERFVGTDGMLDMTRLRLIARLGYLEDYAVVDEVFRLPRLAETPTTG
jgi:flavin reductase (DIM6/NTAB) family NADH-FMN oxidoreductase RutF